VEDLHQEMPQVIVVVAVVALRQLAKVQQPEMVEPEKSLRLLEHILAVEVLAVHTLQTAALVESAAVETVEMVPEVPVETMALQILAAAAVRWEMRVAEIVP